MDFLRQTAQNRQASVVSRRYPAIFILRGPMFENSVESSIPNIRSSYPAYAVRIVHDLTKHATTPPSVPTSFSRNHVQLSIQVFLHLFLVFVCDD